MFTLNTPQSTQNPLKSGNSTSSLTAGPSVSTEGFTLHGAFNDSSNVIQQQPITNDGGVPTDNAANKRFRQMLFAGSPAINTLGSSANAVLKRDESDFPQKKGNFDLLRSRLIGNAGSGITSGSENIKKRELKASEKLEKKALFSGLNRGSDENGESFQPQMTQISRPKEMSRPTGSIGKRLFGDLISAQKEKDLEPALSFLSFKRIDNDIPVNDSTEFDLTLNKLDKQTSCDRLDKETAVSIAGPLFKELSYDQFQLYGSFAKSLIDNDQQKADFGDIDIVTSLPFDRGVERLSSALKNAGIPFDNSERRCNFIITCGDKKYQIQLLDKDLSREAFPKGSHLDKKTGRFTGFEPVTVSGFDLYCVPLEFHTEADIVKQNSETSGNKNT